MDLRTSLDDPLAQRLRDHFTAIGAADVLQDAMQAYRVGQCLDDADAVDPPLHLRREADPTMNQLLSMVSTIVLASVLNTRL